jgi:hypothetical protein
MTTARKRTSRHRENEREELPLEKAAQYLLDECRMVLPGIQALFGFQLIVVFSDGFARDLTERERWLHLAAITMTSISVALIMAPAAYHRFSGAREVSSEFIRISTRLLLASMAPLALSISADVYLIARLIAGAFAASAIAAASFALFVLMWFVVPRRWSQRAS